MSELERLQKRAQRERLARKEAERLLENKSRELFYANQTLAEREEKTRSVLQAINDGILTYDEEGIIQSCNPGAENIFGCQSSRLLDQPISSLFPSSTLLIPAEEHDPKHVEESRIRRVDGSSCPIELNIGVVTLGSGRVYIATLRDITERNTAQERIKKLAYYDALTGLPNRSVFLDRLELALNNAKRHDDLVAVMFIDLDRFKRVNDTLGHNVGDHFLTQVAKRLRNTIRTSDTVTQLHRDEDIPLLTRLGGDEFTLLLSRIRNANDVARVGQRILEDLRRPVRIDGHELVLTGSIGISLFPGDGEDADAVLRNADVAMYQGKKSGRDQATFYSSSMNETALHVLTLEEELRHALQNSEFEVHYQPKVSIQTRKPVGAEALVRWRHPKQGLMMPGEFLPVAEETGLLGPISDWVLRESCRQIRDWASSGRQPLPVSVNISNQQFNGEMLLNTLESVLQETGIDPGLLELELTESIVMENAPLAVEISCNIREMGISLSIDDFGTGYSSMSHLKRLALDKLKIDRSFVMDLGEDPEDEAIIKAITALAHSMRLEVIAEGVETEAQLNRLGQYGCDEAQGFLFSRAIPADEFAKWLE
ncbi:MAG: EAL domain-containing protein [Candidatus Sedimenticola sp. (ex Thyasira tokunagai)]